MSEGTRVRALGINHVALEVGDVDEALAFYGQVFELTLRGRAGSMAFVDLGDQFVALAAGNGEPAGTHRHFGLVVEDKDAVRARLQELGLGQGGGRNLRLHDPWGNVVEIVDYRDVPERDFDVISSIGLTEHIGVRNYPSYFGFLLDRLKPGGRLLNHSITRPDNRFRSTGAFIDRYIFPDGELIGSGRIIAEAQDAGFEVRHEENLREHYALTLAAWSDNLVAHWDEAVAEVGHPTAKIWGLYLAACRVGFERNNTQLHQVLAVKLDDDANAHFPLRPTWLS